MENETEDKIEGEQEKEQESRKGKEKEQERHFSLGTPPNPQICVVLVYSTSSCSLASFFVDSTMWCCVIYREIGRPILDFGLANWMLLPPVTGL